MKLQTELSLSSKLFFLVLGVQYDDIGPLAVADTRGGEGEGGGVITSNILSMPLNDS